MKQMKPGLYEAEKRACQAEFEVVFIRQQAGSLTRELALERGKLKEALEVNSTLHI